MLYICRLRRLGELGLEKFIIQGNTRLIGEVEISGAKNAAVAILPATLLIDGITTLENVPNISDVKIMCDILTSLGADVKWTLQLLITLIHWCLPQ